VLLACCVAVVAALGAWFQHTEWPGWLDKAVDRPLYTGLGGHRGLLLPVAALGTAVPVTVMACALVLASLVLRRWRAAVLVAVAVPVASGLTELLLKPVIGRTIEGAFSFPSGRATGAFSIAAALAVLLIDPARPRRPAALRVLVSVAAVLLAAAVAVAAIALRFHYFTDTVGGAAVGTGTVLATALILDRLAARRQRRQPAAGSADSGRVRAGALPGREQCQLAASR
jgi:undecaprenyl-diphosphatase